jgi:hypothetical protein
VVRIDERGTHCPAVIEHVHPKYPVVARSGKLKDLPLIAEVREMVEHECEVSSRIQCVSWFSQDLSGME